MRARLMPDSQKLTAPESPERPLSLRERAGVRVRLTAKSSSHRSPSECPLSLRERPG